MKMFSLRISVFIAGFALGCFLVLPARMYAGIKPHKKYKVLIVDGQNNHGNWPQTTQWMRSELEETGLFSVEVATTPPHGKSMDGFKPHFADYNVILLNYNGDDWPADTEKAFEDFVRKGGGVVSVHAADNAFPGWTEYNKMIGLGGWGNRNEKWGPYLYYDDQQGKYIRDNTPGQGGSHGKYYAFQVKIRDSKNPITRGMPPVWMHDKDELYNRLRGPAQHMDVLATAYSAKDQGGTGRSEPIMMVIRYGKGRIFHTTLGHGTESQKCAGFITYLQRGTEWAASGKVTQQVPKDFPGPNQVSERP